MEISNETLKQFKEYFDERYVLQKDCDDRQEKTNNKFANDDKRIEIISHDFAMIKKLVWAIATSSIGSLVVAFFQLILK